MNRRGDVLSHVSCCFPPVLVRTYCRDFVFVFPIFEVSHNRDAGRTFKF